MGGVSPGIAYGSVPVGLADSVVLAGDPNRQGLQLSNPNANDVWLAFGTAAVVGQSIRLPPNSPPLTYLARDWPGLLAMDLHAITAGAAGRLAGLSLLNQVVQ